MMRSSSSNLLEDLENYQICPITQEPLRDPVVTMDGHTYERKAIQEWFKEYQTSPKTNLPLPSKEIVPNHAFKSIITNFIPTILIRYENKKQQIYQMQKQILYLKFSCWKQMKNFQNQYSQLKVKHQDQMKQLGFRYEIRLAQKKKIIQQLLISYDGQREQMQTQIKQAKLNHQKQKRKFQIQLQQLKAKHSDQIQQLGFRYEIRLAQKEKYIQQRQLYYQNQKRKHQEELAYLKEGYQKQMERLKSKIKNQSEEKLEKEEKQAHNQQNKNKNQRENGQLRKSQQNQPNKKINVEMNLKLQRNALLKKSDYEVSLNNLLKQSSILDREGLNLLIQWLIKPISKIQFKFKASENGFKLNKYYETCGTLNNTIIIAKTTKGKIIGGYTPLNFYPPGNKNSHNCEFQYLKDQSKQSFLFSLSEKIKFQLIEEDKPVIQRTKNKQRLHFYNTFIIRDNSNTWNKDIYKRNSFRLCQYPIYRKLNYTSGKPNNLKIIGQQSQWFLTAQWQVYQVFFK